MRAAAVVTANHYINVNSIYLVGWGSWCSCSICKSWDVILDNAEDLTSSKHFVQLEAHS